MAHLPVSLIIGYSAVLIELVGGGAVVIYIYSTPRMDLVMLISCKYTESYVLIPPNFDAELNRTNPQSYTEVQC